MGVEVMSSKQSQVSAEGSSSVQFGSVNGTPVKGELKKDHEANVANNVSANGELNKAPDVNVPNNVREEWPEPSQIHSFYVVKYRSYDDEKLKAHLELADKELQKIYRARTAVIEKLRPLRAERQQLLSQIRPLNEEKKQFWAVIDQKRKEMEPLQKNLGQIRSTMGGGGREKKGPGLCSSEEELDAYLKSLQYRIQHESITLNEEKQILREIKQLESTRDKVIANAAARAKIEESVGDKESLQEQVKLIGVNIDGVRKEQDAVMAKLKKLEVEKGPIDDKINFLEEELVALDKKKENANKAFDDLRSKLRDVNAPFYQNADLLKTFREHAAKKDIESLKSRTEAEVEKFVSQWTSRKDFRDDYERRILVSLDMRQLSRDGRMRNPDEKPLVLPNKVVPSEVIKQPKEDSVSTQKKDAAIVEKVSKEQKEANNKKKDGLLEKSDHAVGKGADSDFEILQKDPPKVEEVDQEKLKEIKREEEIAKNRQALERKKKLAEKAAAKAAIKAQKEAEEKKRKELEKKARKKAGTSGTIAEAQESNGTEKVEQQEVAEEEEDAEEKIEQAAPSQKRERKENVVRNRTRGRGTGSLPKAILKRKKATNYWPYAAAAATLAVILLLAVGYNYFV